MARTVPGGQYHCRKPVDDMTGRGGGATVARLLRGKLRRSTVAILLVGAVVLAAGLAPAAGTWFAPT